MARLDFMTTWVCPAAGLALAIGMQLTGAASASATERQVVAGAQYRASSVHRFLFGSDYRDLWTTPFVVEELDFAHEAGGLKVLRRIGGQQTKGLALTGKDGKNYTFRGLEKDAADLIEEELRGTVVERTLQDQMAAQHPASELIVRALSDAVGIPCPSWRMVVLPNDPALGEFQKAFAGAIGVFAEYPSAVTKTNPGFLGITEIVDHKALYQKLEAGKGDAIDAQALLKARLFDILVGDWDRHRKQWRWAKLPGKSQWTPIPEDRDQAFSRYEGYVLDRARGRDSRFQNLQARYPNLGGLTFNGWEQDRRLLVGLTRDDFKRTATDLGGLLSDEALARAVAAMPTEWAKLDGPRLLADMKGRRAQLAEVAEKYYLHLADRVDVYMTEQPETVIAKRAANGDLGVTIAIVADGKPGAPWYERVFHRGETEEVRLYALAGNDAVVVTGNGGGPRLRVIGGPGDDSLDARQGGNAKLSDTEGTNHAVAASIDEQVFVPPAPPKNAPWIPLRDWGSETWTSPWLSYHGGSGAFIGTGLEHLRYGFRRAPYASHQLLRAGFAFSDRSGRLEYLGDFYRENRASFWSLHAFGSGIESLRFYGFGNETVNTADDDFYRAETNQFLVHPSFNLRFGKRTTLSLGPVAKLTQTEKSEDELVNVARPYGSGDFGELAGHAELVYDARDSAVFTRHGGLLAARASIFPAAWDVKSTFGEIDANANGYLSAGKRVTFAVRAGAKKVFGDFPYFEAAAIGGRGLGTAALGEPDHTVRGFRTRRFIGDASVYGNLDVRLKLSRITLFLPGHFGVLAFADTGRVWQDGDTSDTWHSGVGGGIWISLLNYRTTISAGVAHSREDNLLYLGTGFTF